MRLSLPSVLAYCALISACAAGGNNGDLLFDAPPAIGAVVITDRHDVRCESRVGARFMANTGFLHPDCATLPQTGMVEWQILEREFEQVAEGGLWLLRARRGDGEESWLVVPWHDWA